MAKRQGTRLRRSHGLPPKPPRPSASHAKGGQGCLKASLIVAAVALAFACVIASMVTSCISGLPQSALPASGMFHAGSQGVYDWGKLHTVNGRYAYYDEGTRKSRFGIDVSDVQGDIDWAQVASDRVEFAMIRCGYRGITDGGVYDDEHFQYNIDNAAAQGIDVGVYFYSQAISEEEAVEEAERCLALIGGRKLQYPVAYDFEESMGGGGRADDLSVEQASANARAFCKVIEDAGYSTMIYGNQHDLNDYDERILADEDIWYAEYGSSAPTSAHRFSIWQYSNEGAIAGISTAVDLNIDLSGV